jgi:hypothetical protein
MPKSKQKKRVEEGCALARDRYMAMTPDEAKIQFSYELQSFLSSMNNRREWPLALGVQKVVELLVIIATTNKII